MSVGVVEVSVEGRSEEWAAVAWAPYSRRSEMFARELGGKLHCVHHLKFRSPMHAPFKYLMQAVHTLWVLARERPTAVHVQNPPFVCGLVVDLYCRISGARFITEFHSAAFGRAWRWSLPIQKYLARRAAMNIVTSDHWARIVGSWGGRTVVMHDPFLDLPQGKVYRLGSGFNVAFIGTFAEDEPIDDVLSAARLVPDVHFYITGDLDKAPVGVAADAPDNVTFTGFLDMNGEYLGLLREADAVMVLTTRDDTLQLAGCEAVAVGKPLVTSDWSYLRDLFGGVAIFVEPTSVAIARGVREVKERHAELIAEIKGFRDIRRGAWNERMAELTRAVSSGGNGESTERSRRR